uniref:ATP synthase F0 subunit 8 n=1 Tax=Nereis zonata TaxID=880888 RepID=A0A7M3UIX5_9ANNE|nr:ATP synthase F0 subunit 8 [Nereis zonata]QOH99540.1 ATP synthase F0 subunit 8 [Nereis zonata]
MPHLSPMNWITMPLIMIFVLLTLVTILWWQFIPSFPPCAAGGDSAPKSWKWW